MKRGITMDKCSCCGERTSDVYELRKKVKMGTTVEGNIKTTTYNSYSKTIFLCSDCRPHVIKAESYITKDRITTGLISIVLIFAQSIRLFCTVPFLSELLYMKTSYGMIADILYSVPIVVLIYAIVRLIRLTKISSWMKKNPNHESPYGSYIITSDGELADSKILLNSQKNRYRIFCSIYSPVLLLLLYII